MPWNKLDSKPQGEVLFDFPGSFKDEIYLKAGDRVEIYAELEGWYFGKCLPSLAVGVFPANFVQLDDAQKNQSKFLTFFKPDTIEAIATETLLELANSVNEYLKNKKYSELRTFIERSQDLRFKRDQICNPKTNPKAKAQLTEEILEQILGLKKDMEIEFIYYNPDTLKVATAKSEGPMKMWNICLQKDPEKRLSLRRSVSDLRDITSQLNSDSLSSSMNGLDLRSPTSVLPSERTRRNSILQVLDFFKTPTKKGATSPVRPTTPRPVSPSRPTSGSNQNSLKTRISGTPQTKRGTMGKSAAFNTMRIRPSKSFVGPMLDLDSTDLTTKKVVVHRNIHFFLSIQRIQATIGEPCELRFMLMSQGVGGRQLSEPFVVHLDENMQIHQTQTMSVAWKYIQVKENAEVALFVTVHRRGRLISKDSKKKSQKEALCSLFRRPLAAAFAALGDTEEESRQLAFFSCSDLQWPKIFDHLSLNDPNIQQFKSITVNITQKLFANTAFEVIWREVRESKIIPTDAFSSVPLLNALSLPDTFPPSYNRNDLVLTILNGDFGSNDKVLVAVELRTKKGETLPNPVKYGGSPEGYHSQVLVGTKQPQYNESIVFNINTDHYSMHFKLQECHIFFTFYQCNSDMSVSKDLSKGMFGYSFLRLAPANGRLLIPNGPDRLTVFKFPAKIPTDPIWYLSSEPTPRKGESFSLDFRLVSTSLTQSENLDTFLHWKKRKYVPNENIWILYNTIPFSEILKFPIRFTKVFLQMMVHNPEKDKEKETSSSESLKPDISLLPHSDPCFRVLINFFANIYDTKSEEYKEMLHNIPQEQEHPRVPLVFLEHLCQYFNPATFYNIENIDFLKKIFTVMPTIAHLISCFYQQSIGSFAKNHKAALQQSRPVHHSTIGDSATLPSLQSSFSQLSVGYSEDTFKGEDKKVKRHEPVFRNLLEKTLGSLCDLIKSKSSEFRKNVLPFALREFSTLFKIYAYVGGDIISVASRLFMSVEVEVPESQPTSRQAQDDLQEQIVSFLSLVKTVMAEIEGKPLGSGLKAVYSHILRILQTPPSWEIVQQAIDPLALILDRIETGQEPFPTNDMLPFVGTMLNLVQKAKARNQQLFMFFGTTLLAILNGFSLTELSEGVAPNARHRDELLAFFEQFANDSFYNRYWLDLNMYASCVVIKVLRAVGHHEPMRAAKILVMLSESPVLDLEKYPSSARKRLLHAYGDPREALAEAFEHLQKTQEGQKQHDEVKYLETSVRFMLIRSPLTKKIGFQLFEANLAKQDFAQTMLDTMLSLDTVARENKLDQDFEAYFIPRVNKAAVNSKSQTASLDMFRRGVRLLVTLSKAVTRIEKVFAIDDLLGFFYEIGQQDLYLQYTHRLSQLQIALGLFCEGGNALMLHAKQLAWNHTKMLPALPLLGMPLPAQTEFQRKKHLYRDIIANYRKASYWEKSIDMFREQAEQYRKVHDFQALTRVLTSELELARLSLYKDRLNIPHFYVACYGRGAPPCLMNKEFIWRGAEGDRQASFIEKFKNQFNCTIISTRDAVDEKLKSDPGFHFQVYPITPSCHEELSSPTGTLQSVRDFPARMRRALRQTDTNIFLHTKPFTKGPKGNFEVENLWTQNVFYETKETLPSRVGWSEIVKTTEVLYTPLQNAIQNVFKKNLELEEMTEIYSDSSNGTPQNVNTFTMLLNGVVDAAVSGGTTIYKKIFFEDPNYLKEHPDHKVDVSRLAELMNQQIQVLKKALAIHAGLINPTMVPIQKKMEGLLLKLESEPILNA